ncbi:alpha beta hydrolase domain-containing 13 [Brachionus plicatilis]|uniref:Protein ABHD13 n=1 Tax=Brachionus plicatilis TaxID=10195 RepID=A0A3M7S934_BRAPC|nr:alpha beta hydrolase domain-containing 13 [Brachionus plicatilis]
MNILRSLFIKIKFWGKIFKNKILSNSKNNYQNLNEIRAHNDKNSKLFNTMKLKIRSLITHELLIWLGSFGEIFFALFILSYAVYPSGWSISLIFMGVLAVLYNNQDMFVYHPTEPPESKVYIELPSLYNLPFEKIDLITSDSVRLHSYLIKQQSEVSLNVPTLVMFHGNAGNIGQRICIAHYVYHYCCCNVFLVEYRGYGLSEGTPSEIGFYKDAEAAILYLFNRNDINTHKIIPYGQSIGGAVVIDLARKYNERLYAFIVENTFTSLPEIGKELFSGIPGIFYLPEIFFKNQYQSINKIKSITIPGLFISGLSDTMIPPRMMKALFEKSCSRMKRMLQIAEGNHNNTWLCPGYFQFMLKFIQEISNAQFEKDAQTTDQNAACRSQVWLVNSRSPRT